MVAAAGLDLPPALETQPPGYCQKPHVSCRGSTAAGASDLWQLPGVAARAGGHTARLLVAEEIFALAIGIHALIVRADEADGSAIVGRGFASHAEHGAKDDLWSGCGRERGSGGPLDKVAAGAGDV